MEHKTAARDTPAPATAQAQPDPGKQLTLPTLVFGLPEVRRLKLELQNLEDFMRQAAIRQPGSQPSLPRLSRLCEALATDNRLNLLQTADRKLLSDFLADVIKTAPAIHISFAADPSSAFTAKIVTWLRTAIHPATLLQVGLQPTIAAGCIVRTPNKEFDFSLRERFSQQESLLLNAFEAMAGEVSPRTSAQASAAPTAAAVAATPEPLAAAPGAAMATPEQVAQEAIAAALGIDPSAIATDGQPGATA